ncbi:unnamed protein product [Haemonchus placei]|uniref:BHLH domain-containing protein n=1 Tax=Haemonchus placei TaxID=6290 RepID=A0A0N4W1I8_HAEPC|nr:unnamed protein product [Haemonchus placei]
MMSSVEMIFIDSQMKLHNITLFQVESTLRRLVGSDESTSQLELVLSAIRYIRELQSQLENDKENDVPDTVTSNSKTIEPSSLELESTRIFGNPSTFYGT